MNDYEQFITTEPLGKGAQEEQKVWDAVKKAFAGRDCLGYWRYPIFSQVGKFRQEPDILIADREWGLIIIEVKAIAIEQLVAITGHRWEYQNFYITSGNPYQQAENQLRTLLEYSDREPMIRYKITGRALVALPAITRSQWAARGFDQLPTTPPILFQDCLSPALFYRTIQQTPPIQAGTFLDQQQWQLLLAVLAGTPLYRKASHRVLASPQSRGAILQKLRDRLTKLDWQQERIGKQIPPGLQRLRGIAGSGKTVLLCQKAAHMHLKHPEWNIALVFLSRSLYHPIQEQLDRWLRYFSNHQQSYDPKNKKLRVLHAWGAKQQPGLYSLLCKLTGVQPLSVKDIAKPHRYRPNEALAIACTHLLEQATIPQYFDAILIDEGQDLIVEDPLKFNNKQPFYWLAYQALRPVDPVQSELRRLIWAYDEVQSLECLNIPSAGELFGDELGHLVTGEYSDGIKKSEILSRCYRTPHAILTAAHGIGMGLLRPGGMLAGMTRSEDWQAIGYDVQGRFTPNQIITLQRPPANSPNPISQLWEGELIHFQAYRTRQEELTALATRIFANLRQEGLRPSREILVLVVGSFFEAMRLETTVASFLLNQGIDIFIPGTRDCNILKPDRNDRDPNRFWCEGGVTVSRIHRAKGQESDLVYVVGLDLIAKQESNLYLRNQLFVALTRARAWVNVSGIGSYPLYEEFYRVLQSGDTFTFPFRRPPQRELSITDVGELLRRYAEGGRNFQNADLCNAQLAGLDLRAANLIGAQLQGANLRAAQLDGVKLAIADLSWAELTNASLRKAKLVGAILHASQLSYSDLSYASLNDADLQNANLVGACLMGSNLSAANLSGANLTGANLEKANLSDACLAGTVMPDGTVQA